MVAHALLQDSKGMAAASSLPRLQGGEWLLAAFSGRFVEITGGDTCAALTLCARLILESQQRGGVTAWVGGTSTGFYPPDVAGTGVDLQQLIVVRVEEAPMRWRVCDTLLRSGSFSVVVVHVEGALSLPLAAQTRLSAVAQRYQTALLAITRRTRKEAIPSSLVSMRAETFKERRGHDCFICGAEVVKEKRGVAGWKHEELCRGTDSLC